MVITGKLGETITLLAATWSQLTTGVKNSLVTSSMAQELTNIGGTIFIMAPMEQGR